MKEKVYLRDTVVDLFRKGKRPSAIADSLGLSRVRISHILKKARLEDPSLPQGDLRCSVKKTDFRRPLITTDTQRMHKPLEYC
jgi:DNA invertase Pin-like site-specific DNA recombinase